MAAKPLIVRNRLHGRKLGSGERLLLSHNCDFAKCPALPPLLEHYRKFDDAV